MIKFGFSLIDFVVPYPIYEFLGMLLEHASKKDFAIVFTNNYGDIIKDFIQVPYRL